MMPWTYLDLLYMLNLLRSPSLRGRIVRWRSLGPMSKFNLGSRREIQNKILQALLILSKKEVVDLNFLNLLVTIVERNIMESASPVLMDDMGVEIMIIKWNIFLFVWLEEGRSHKLLIMARNMMLRSWIISMFFKLTRTRELIRMKPLVCDSSLRSWCLVEVSMLFFMLALVGSSP